MTSRLRSRLGPATQRWSAAWRCRHRARDERGASLVEFALVVTVFLGVTSLAFFAAHAYEVRSDLQRAAEKTALYAATRLDPRVIDSDDPAWPDAAAVLAYADDAVDADVDFTDAVDQATCPLSDDKPAVSCVVYSPTDAGAPVTNQQVHVQLRRRWETPFSPLLRVMGLSDVLVDLTADGRAVIE